MRSVHPVSIWPRPRGQSVETKQNTLVPLQGLEPWHAV